MKVLATLRETKRLAWCLAGVLEPGDVVFLEGDLGTGKTTLARGIARGLGVPFGVSVTSPTFSLVHEYPARLLLLHADFYRLGANEELFELGLDEALAEGAVLVAEWAYRFREGIAEHYVRVLLEVEGTTRYVCIDGVGSMFERVREALVASGHGDVLASSSEGARACD